LALKGFCEALAPHIVKSFDEDRKLEALEELAIYILAQHDYGAFESSDASWQTVMNDISSLLRGHAAQVRELRSKANLLAEFFDRFRVVMEEVGKSAQNKSAASSFDASLNDLMEILLVVENVGWRWAKSTKRIMEEGAYSDIIALRYPFIQHLKGLCDFANRRLRIPRLVGVTSEVDAGNEVDPYSRQQQFQVHQRSARMIDAALAEQCTSIRDLATSMLCVLEMSLTGVTLSLSREQEEYRRRSNEEVAQMQNTAGKTARRRAPKGKRAADLTRLPKYVGPIDAIQTVRMGVGTTRLGGGREARQISASTRENVGGLGIDGIVTQEAFGINHRYELKKELTIRPRRVPGLLAAESVFLRYIVESRLDQALEQVMMEVLLSSLSTNPYPQIAARMSTFAIKQSLWSLTDEELLQQLDDCGRSTPRLVDSLLQVASLSAPLPQPEDKGPDESSPSNTDSPPQPAPLERIKIYGDAHILGKIAPGGALAISSLLQCIPRLSDFSTAVPSDGMTCDISVSLCSGTILTGSGMLASPLPAVVEAQTDILMSYILQANANEASTNFANYVVDSAINLHDRTKHCLVGLYIGECAYSWGAGKATKSYTIDQLKTIRESENATKNIKSRPFEKIAIHALMEIPLSLLDATSLSDRLDFGVSRGGYASRQNGGIQRGSEKLFVPLVLRLKFFIEGPPPSQSSNYTSFGGAGAGLLNPNAQAFSQAGCEGMLHENIYGSFIEAKLLRRAFMRSSIPRGEIQTRFRAALHKDTSDYLNSGSFLKGYLMGGRAALQSDGRLVFVSFARMLRSLAQACHYLEYIGRSLLLLLDLPTAGAGGGGGGGLLVNTGLLKINTTDIYFTINMYVSNLATILDSPECVHFEAAASTLRKSLPDTMRKDLYKAAEYRGRPLQAGSDGIGVNLKILREAQQLLLCLRLAISGDVHDISAASVESWLTSNASALSLPGSTTGT
jgi:hypothetical protein